MIFTKKDIDNRYQCKISGRETIRIGAAIILTTNSNEILLERRKDCGWWGITGGQLNAGETIEECALRETHEETGVKLLKSNLNLIGIYSEPKEGRILQYPDNRVHLVDIVFTAAINECKFTISQESYELKLFKMDKLPENIVPPAINPLLDLKTRQNLV